MVSRQEIFLASKVNFFKNKFVSTFCDMLLFFQKHDSEPISKAKVSIVDFNYVVWQPRTRLLKLDSNHKVS